MKKVVVSRETANGSLRRCNPPTPDPYVVDCLLQTSETRLLPVFETVDQSHIK